MSALTGPELLAKVKELESEGFGKNDLARMTGYVSTKKDGTEKINRSAFFEALLEAKGVHLEGGTKSPGRKLTFRTKVQFNGNLMVGSAYTGQVGFRPGDEFQIVVNRKGFTLKPVTPSNQCPDGTCQVVEQDSDQSDPIDGDTQDGGNVDSFDGEDTETQSPEEVQF